MRLKIHVSEDTRYIMLPNISTVTFAELTDRIAEKFGLGRNQFRCRIRDDGDMITLGDQDDLDMAFMSAKEAAKREGGTMGKMEVGIIHLIVYFCSSDR